MKLNVIDFQWIVTRESFFVLLVGRDFSIPFSIDSEQVKMILQAFRFVILFLPYETKNQNKPRRATHWN